MLPQSWRKVATLLAMLGGPVARLWAGALGGWLRSKGPIPPASLAWLYPLWREVGRYAGWQ